MKPRTATQIAHRLKLSPITVGGFLRQNCEPAGVVKRGTSGYTWTYNWEEAKEKIIRSIARNGILRVGA